MTLQELMSHIKDKKAEASIDPSQCDPRIMSGAEGLVRAAKVETEALEQKYKEAVVKSAVVIAVDGQYAEKFAQVCVNDFNTLAVNYKLVVDKIADNIAKRGGEETYNNNEHYMAMAELNQIKLEYGFIRMAAPLINHYTDQVYYQPIKVALDNMFQKNYEHMLYSAITRREIGNLALAAEFTGKMLPVVVYNCDGNVDNQFLPEPVQTISAVKDDFTKTDVKKILTFIWRKVNKTDTKPNNKGQDNE